MEAIKTIDEIRQRVTALKKGGRSVGFVPTMGALHEGHLSLIKLAAEHTDEVVVSIYVNPEQFGPNEDFDTYPRRLKSDLEKCEKAGVNCVFSPSDEVMYGAEKFLRIQIEELNRYMDGGSRPGFFEGIVLVVNKLFNIIQPDVAVFGQKDIQQFRILQQMAAEFNHSTRLVMGPIVRANDGLALSSRNAYLSDKEREQAPGLYRSLRYVRKQILDGAKNISLLLQHQRAELEAKGFEIDYFGLFSYNNMAPAERVSKENRYILAGAVYLGKTRLIDNMIIDL